MSTIIDNPTHSGSTVVDTNDSSGWTFAIVILLIIIAIGGYFLFFAKPKAATTERSPVINVTIPAPPVGAGGAQNTPSSN